MHIGCFGIEVNFTCLHCKNSGVNKQVKNGLIISFNLLCTNLYLFIFHLICRSFFQIFLNKVFLQINTFITQIKDIFKHLAKSKMPQYFFFFTFSYLIFFRFIKLIILKFQFHGLIKINSPYYITSSTYYPHSMVHITYIIFINSFSLIFVLILKWTIF